MISKRCFYLLLLYFFLSNANSFGQSPVKGIGNVLQVKIDDQTVIFSTATAHGAVMVYSPAIIRVRIDQHPLAKDFSYAVIAQPQKTKATITQNAQEVTSFTDSLKAVIKKAPYSITFYTPSGEVISRDEPGLGVSWV